MKKTFAFVCACMFGLSVIGCGGDAATTETPETPANDTEATTTDAGATTDEAAPVAETTEGEATTTDAPAEDAAPTE